MSGENSKLSGAAYCLAQTIGGLLVWQNAVTRSALCDDLRMPVSSFVVRRRLSQSERLEYLENDLI